MSYITRRYFASRSAKVLAGSVAAVSLFGSALPVSAQKRKPNFIILFADDMGYGDWEGGGHPTIRTPNLMKMAREGVTISQFYSGCAVCSPSRAALLTGRNYIRTGVTKVFFPGDERGMPVSEITIADALKSHGYTTACIGKWHLGGEPAFRPDKQGFDFYFGLLHSNNMFDFKLYRNNEIIEDPVDQSTLTKRYTEEAIGFIEREQERPFFLYLPYTMPHVPVYASEKFLGKSLNGIYGDAVEEIDWSVKQLIDSLKRLGLSENTLVMFTSDNGPASYKPVPRGTAGIFRGCKGDTWEGGMRVPFIAWWPGTLPAGTVSHAVGSVVDLFPTCLAATGIPLPDDRPYDGIDLSPVFDGNSRPERTIYYYREDELYAVRHGKWKLHFKVYDYPGGDYHSEPRKVRTPEQPLLFDLEIDPSEQYECASENPDVVKRLITIADNYSAEIVHNNENRDLIVWFNNEFTKKDHKLTGKN
ncbi:MAG: sulfatase [Candidatus Latescibacteria bacterium]|nr:sulfatase [Candidatus Latescibacterota bacterium]